MMKYNERYICVWGTYFESNVDDVDDHPLYYTDDRWLDKHHNFEEQPHEKMIGSIRSSSIKSQPSKLEHTHASHEH